MLDSTFINWTQLFQFSDVTDNQKEKGKVSAYAY